jgi:N4-gp56 family major capsid protein
MHTQRWATFAEVPRKKGATITWRRYRQFAPLTAPMHETITPAAQPLISDDYNATLQMYGAVTQLTTVCHDLQEDNVLDVIVKNSGRQAAETVETVTLNVLKSGTSVVYAGTATSRATVAGVITRGMLRKVDRFFQNNDAEPITQMLTPSAATNTWGIDESFFVLVHTDLRADVKNMTGFVGVASYAHPTKRLPNEIGACENFRFVATRLLTPWLAAGADSDDYLHNGAPTAIAAAADVYPVLFLAKEAYGAVRLTGMKAANIKVLQPGEARGGDEAGQRGSVAWTLYYACAILCEERIVRGEVCATADPE